MQYRQRPVSLSLPEDIINEIDKAAEHDLKTRAAYMRDALLDRLRREKRISLVRNADGSVYEMAPAGVLS